MCVHCSPGDAGGAVVSVAQVHVHLALGSALRNRDAEALAAYDKLMLTVTLARSEGMSWNAIGEEMGVSGTTMQSRHARWVGHREELPMHHNPKRRAA